jgi:hypothetical protein
MDLDDGILKMQVNKNYKEIPSPSVDNFSDYYIKITHVPVPLDSVYNEKEAYYIPKKYSSGHAGSGVYIRYFYYKDNSSDKYIRATSFD